MDGLFGDGLVDVLCCGGDSLEEDLRWGPRLGALVDLVEFDDGVTSGGEALFKTVEIMDSNTSLPWILTPRHFLAVSAICFERSDFACTCFFRQVFGTQLWLSDL